MTTSRFLIKLKEKLELGENQVWAWVGVFHIQYTDFFGIWLYAGFCNWMHFLYLRKPDHILGHIYAEVPSSTKDVFLLNISQNL